MGVAYEDNFGFWDLDEPEELAFFHHVQRQSFRAVCKRCDGVVRLLPPKIFCAPCTSALECGAPISINDYSMAARESDAVEVKPSRRSPPRAGAGNGRSESPTSSKGQGRAEDAEAPFSRLATSLAAQTSSAPTGPSSIKWRKRAVSGFAKRRRSDSPRCASR